jgi:hypothetical protein
MPRYLVMPNRRGYYIRKLLHFPQTFNFNVYCSQEVGWRVERMVGRRGSYTGVLG